MRVSFTVKCLYTEQICVVVVDRASGQTKKDNSVSLVFLVNKVDGIKGNLSVFIFSCFVITRELLFDMIGLEHSPRMQDIGMRGLVVTGFYR